MNKKDYEEIAEIIKHNFDDFVFQGDELVLAKQNVVNGLADYFEKEWKDEHNIVQCDNMKKFDREEFLKKCGVL
jgi:hypothetical protein